MSTWGIVMKQLVKFEKWQVKDELTANDSVMVL